MTRILFVVVLMALFMQSCSPQHEPNAKEKDAIAQDIRKTLSQYYDDIRAEGLMAELKYLDDSKEFFWVPPGYSSPLSYDSVVHILRANAPALKSINNTWDSLAINPLTNKIASYTGVLHSVVTDTSGKVTEMRLIETGTLIKRERGWKLLYGQTSVLGN